MAFISACADLVVLGIRNTRFSSNTYICHRVGEKACAVIDPGTDPELVESTLNAHGVAPSVVLCTHGHFDHIAGAKALQEKYGCPTYLHASDARLARAANFFLMAGRFPLKIAIPAFDTIDANAVVHVGSLPFRFHHFPGHTPGSCVIEVAARLFTGDTLLSQGVDETPLPEKEPDLLRTSIRNLIGTFHGGSLVFPGHGRWELSLESVVSGNEALAQFLADRAPAAQ